MIIAIIALVISFFLESITSCFFPNSLNMISYFTTIYTIITLVVLYPYFDNNKKYYMLLVIFGILFDIIYTNTFLLNIVLFFIVSLFVRFINYHLATNLLNINIISIIAIIIYHLFSYFILEVIGYLQYPFMLFINIISHSLIMTIIYTTILYLILKKVYMHVNIKTIR